MGMAFLNMQLDVKGPTQVGDTIYVHCEVIESRPTSKPDRGLLRTMNRIVNQHGDTVITYNPLRMLRRRPA
jgi:acyl dehydratase